jgi:hypothetical protein
VSRRRSVRRTRISDLSIFDPSFFIEGLGSFGAPRLDRVDVLELLGEDEEERVETVVAMLRRSSEEDVNELIRIVQQALERVARERAL